MLTSQFLKYFVRNAEFNENMYYKLAIIQSFCLITNS